MVLMRAAAGWGILGNAVEPLFERFTAVAARVSAGQPLTQDMENTLGVASAAFNDAEVRKALLTAKAHVFSEVVQQLGTAFCDAWFHGLQKFVGGKKTAESALLGKAAKWWPRLLGLALRMAHHLQHQLPHTAIVGLDPAADVKACPAADIQAQICSALTSKQAVDLLLQLESTIDANLAQEGEPRTKRARTAGSATLPSDIDQVLAIYERSLEGLSVSRHLRSLQHEDLQVDDCALDRSLHDMYWRWADAADQLRPLEGNSRFAKAWVSSGYIFQQVIRTRLPNAALVSIAKLLFLHVTDEVPAAADDLKTVVRMFFWQFQFKDEPAIDNLIWFLLGQGDADHSAPHERVVECIKEVLPTTLGKLRFKFMPGAGVLPEPQHDCAMAMDGADEEAEAQKKRESLFVMGAEDSEPHHSRSVIPSPCRS